MPTFESNYVYSFYTVSTNTNATYKHIPHMDFYIYNILHASKCEKLCMRMYKYKIYFCLAIFFSFFRIQLCFPLSLSLSTLSFVFPFFFSFLLFSFPNFMRYSFFSRVLNLIAFCLFNIIRLCVCDVRVCLYLHLCTCVCVCFLYTFSSCRFATSHV